MFLDEPCRIESAPGLAGLDEALEALSDVPAVFLIWPREGSPYLARTAMLKRRLKRLLAYREKPGGLLNLREIVSHVDYWPAASRLASNLILYDAARTHFPEDYLKRIKLRPPSYLRLMLGNRFPRFQTTSHLSAAEDLYYGPFRTRADADEFERQCLDLFQIRRCSDELLPAISHPGCIYGEMNLCLRPCQEAVSIEEYASETARAAEFLSSRGRSLLDVIGSARDRLSEEMQFEAAAREHARYEKVQQAARMRGELADRIDRLCGVAIQRSAATESVDLWFLIAGAWLPPVRFPLAIGGQMAIRLVQSADKARTFQMVPLDQRLRELSGSLTEPRISRKEREEHLALLARWYYSTWRDGEWLPFESLDALPYRKLVRAISRVAAHKI